MTNEELIERLRKRMAMATPGPYRAHDHNDMARLGEDPLKWIGYAWVGRVGRDSTPDGRFDAGWADMDRRKDASPEYREKASDDAHFVADALNALPVLLDSLTELTADLKEAKHARDGFQCERDMAREEVARLRKALEPFAEAAIHLHPSSPDDGETLDGLKVIDFRRAYAAYQEGRND